MGKPNILDMVGTIQILGQKWQQIFDFSTYKVFFKILAQSLPGTCFFVNLV